MRQELSTDDGRPFNHRYATAVLQHAAVVWHIERDTEALATGLAVLDPVVQRFRCVLVPPAFAAIRLPPITGLHHFDGIDWIAWRGERTWLGIRGGYNGGNHSNLDLGHFIFGLDRTRYLVDTGN